MEYSRGSEVEKEIGDTATPPPPRPRDNCLGLGEKRQLLRPTVSCLLHGCGQPDFHCTAAHNGVSALQ